MSTFKRGDRLRVVLSGLYTAKKWKVLVEVLEHYPVPRRCKLKLLTITPELEEEEGYRIGSEVHLSDIYLEPINNILSTINPKEIIL